MPQEIRKRFLLRCAQALKVDCDALIGISANLAVGLGHLPDNLLDSLRFASHDRAHGISIVFGGKVIAGTDGRILDTLAGSYDGLIIESFSVGVLPNYGNDSFLNALSDWISAGKLVCMATQVTHEGSDMEVYQVGKVIKEKFPILESYNMTLEASVTKMMWVLGQTQDLPECRRLFYKTINHDLLFL